MAALQGNHVVLVYKLPDVIDEWILKKLPVGKHMSAVEINPTDRSKAIIWTNTREDGKVIVDNLNGLVVEGKTLAACFLSPRNGYCVKKRSGDDLFQRVNDRKKMKGKWLDMVRITKSVKYPGRSSKLPSSASATKVAAVPANFGRNYKRDELLQTEENVAVAGVAYDEEEVWLD